MYLRNWIKTWNKYKLYLLAILSAFLAKVAQTIAKKGKNVTSFSKKEKLIIVIFIAFITTCTTLFILML